MKKLFIVLLLCFCSDLYSQADTASKIGLLGGYSINSHSASFSRLPGIPNCCPNFTDGSGNGIYAAIYFEHNLTDYYDVQWRISYLNHAALLKSPQSIILDVNSLPVTGTFEHSIQSTVSTIALEPNFRRNLFSGLTISAGARIGIISSAIYEQKEEITSPTDRGVFPIEQKRRRNEFAGTIPEASSFFGGIQFGLDYALPLNYEKTLYIVPEVSYKKALTPIIKNYDWFPNALTFGVSLQWRFRSLPPMPPIVPLVPDTVQPAIVTLPKKIIPAPDLANCSISVSEVLPDSTERPINSITIEQRRSRHLRPLLNYVFFDEDNYELDSRYVRMEPDKFNMEDFVNKTTMETYHSVLNIIGWRMAKKRDATLTIVGCNADTRNEKNNKQLSEQRAKSVADFLINVWGIERSRIIFEIRNLPQIPSGLRTEDGLAENRRVELKSNIEEILDPVTTIDTLLFPTPGSVTFRPSILSKYPIKKWKFTVRFAGKEMHSSQSSSGLPYPLTIDLTIFPLGSLQNGEKVIAYLEAEDNDGKNCTSVAELPINIVSIKQKLLTKKVDISRDKYSLILFDYAQSGLTSSNRKIMDEIKSNITPSSTIMVSGHTDRIGSDESNVKLSEKRAGEVGKYIGAKNTTTLGKGKKDLLYDNDFPEGRFYCRTVVISANTEFQNSK